jgi:hypothetical protein
MRLLLQNQSHDIQKNALRDLMHYVYKMHYISKYAMALNKFLSYHSKSYIFLKHMKRRIQK